MRVTKREKNSVTPMQHQRESVLEGCLGGTPGAVRGNAVLAQFPGVPWAGGILVLMSAGQGSGAAGQRQAAFRPLTRRGIGPEALLIGTG